MKYSTLKYIKHFCNQLDSEPEWKKVCQSILDGVPDFDVNNVRFISNNGIDQIQCDELENDLYMLGCFNAWFIADILEIDIDVIEAMQKVEAYEAIGKLIVSMGKLGELQQSYASADGYGHHFNGYDFSDRELNVGDIHYHVFDNR